jgi:hypothetical protein
MMAAESFEELHSCCDYDGGLPQCGKLAKIQVSKICPMMMRSNHVLWTLTFQGQRLSIYLN